MRLHILTLNLLIVLLSSMAYGIESSKYTTDAKVYSVGDLHGDLESFKKALLAVKIIDRSDRWIAENAHLVLVGDLVDRGPETRKLMEYVIELENKAAMAGGHVHTLLGNHEYLVTNGVLEFTHSNDSMDFKDFRKNIYEKGIDGFKNAFKGDNIFAQWFRSRPIIIQINETIFVHAGLDQWAKNLSLDQINDMGLAWLRYFQGVGEKPPESTRWIIEHSGPLWTRVFVDYEHGKQSLSNSDLESILKKFNANKIVVGHSTINSLDIAMNHPTYGSSVIITDTGLSRSYNMQISVFEHFKNGGTTAYKVSREFPRVTEILQSKIPVRICEKLFK